MRIAGPSLPRSCVPVLVLVVSTVCGAAAGLETNAPPELTLPPSTDLLEVLLRMAGALIIVFALFIGGIWLFKRSRLFALYQGGPAQLRVIETRGIGYRNTLVVVAYQQQRFLLSVSATGVNLLTALPDGATEEVSAPVPAPSSFAEQLTALVRKA